MGSQGDYVPGKLLIGESLVWFSEGNVAKEEAVLRLAGLLECGGYVKGSFGRAVLEREEVYPTGLPTKPVGVAIPHTDTEHVKRAALAVGILADPIEFTEMGSADDHVNVSIVAMLAISDPEAVMQVLPQLARALQDEEFLLSLMSAGDEKAVVELVAQRMPELVCVDG
jgi:PTS system galactitol-specific IIA component